MRRLVQISLTVSGIVLFIFVLNILLFSFVPVYHDALETAVAGDSEIPTVVIDENRDAVVIQRSSYVSAESIEEEKEIQAADLDYDLMEEEVPLSGNIDCEKRIVEKTYYEDCGNGKGYWIIKYEDGSTSVEQ